MSMVRSASVLQAARSSALRRANFCGLRRRWLVRPQSSVAVVSEPATLGGLC